MRAADLFRQSRRIINPPYNTYHLFSLIGLLIILLAIPLTIISIQQRQVFTSKGAGGEGNIRFLSKLTDLDNQWRNAGCSASNLNCSVAQMMNANYEAIMSFDCSICREFGNAFTAGPSFVYQDPTMIRTDGSSDSPGVDLNDVLLTTTGQRCWQHYFNGSRYLADVTQQDVQNEIIAKLNSLVADSAFDAIYIDVAEAYLPNAADCSGGIPAVSNAAWLGAWATLAERMQNEVPGALILNSQYFTWQSLVGISSTNADRFWSAPDAVEIEFGWPFGRHGENTASGWQDKINYINRLHGLGAGVFVQDYPGNNGDFALSEEKYGLAMYLLTVESADYYGTFNRDGHGSDFFSGYNANLGASQGPFYTWSGLQRRDFANGFVLVNNPGGGTVTANLGGTYTSLWGETMSSITLAERNGNVFRTSGGGGGDTQDPTVSITSPTNGATVSGTVNITASAADDVGVTRVEFYVDGSLKSTDTSSPYSYSWDSTTVIDGSHALSAKAYDAANKVGTSPTVTVTVANSGAQTLTFTPTADASVKADAPTSNFGASTILEADSSPVEQFLLKFNVSGIDSKQVASAKLRLYNTNASNSGGDFYRVSDTSWSEGTINWNNAPAADPASFASLGSVAAGNWYEVSALSIVSGDGLVSVRVKSASTDGADYYSKEQGASYAPRLVVTVGEGTGEDTQPPTAPTNLQATAPNESRVDLTWTASTDNVGVVGYWIVRNGVTIASTSNATYSDTTVSCGTTYSYYVLAYDAAGKVSAPSNTASVTPSCPEDTTPPSAPTNLTATAVSSSQINLSWNASTDNVGVAGYEVYRNDSKVAVVTTTSWGDTGLAPPTTYSYKVRAFDAAEKYSGYSNTAAATTLAPPSNLGNVSGKVVDSSSGTVLVGVKITISRSGFRSAATTNASGNYTFVNLTAGTYSLK
ncbi:MAG TPA: Ig-like domain-containing protein, partial [Candidatus Nanoarchaeia archaeon]